MALGEVMGAILPKPPSAAINQIASFVWKVLHPAKTVSRNSGREISSPRKCH
jgi:hypothetical protein